MQCKKLGVSRQVIEFYVTEKIIIIIIRRRIRIKIRIIIPIVISSTGVIPESQSQSLKRLNLYPNTSIQMQKSVILGTCSIVRNFLNYETIEPKHFDY